METSTLLPKRVVAYIHEMGVRALNHLADGYQQPSGPAGAKAPNAVQALVDHWNSMTTDDKEKFVDHVAASVVDVVAASAVLPLGLKLGKRAAKATRVVLKKQTKKLRKAAKRIAAERLKKKNKAQAKEKARGVDKAARKAKNQERKGGAKARAGERDTVPKKKKTGAKSRPKARKSS